MAHTENPDDSEYREELGSADHPDGYDHSEPRYTVIALLGAVTIIALIIVGFGVQMYYERTEQKLVYDKVLSQRSWTLDDLRKKEAWEMSHYTLTDKEKGRVRMPIEKAMQMVEQESAANQMKYATNAYAVKTGAELVASPAVSQAGAAAVQGTQQTGITSSPNVQQGSVPQPVAK